MLQRLRPQNEKRTDPLSVAPLSSVTTIFLATVGIEGLSLSTIYGRLMSCWLRPYTSIAPARGRVSLEHLIRQVAAALFLSGIAARKVQAEIKTAGLEERPPLQDGLSKDTVHSQLPSPTPTPSTSDGVPLITLRQYTNVEATAQGLSRPVTKILDHWEPAIDPSDYDYTKKAAQVEDDDPSQVSQEEKQREQRRAESKRRRQESSQRKRAKLEQSTSGAESQSQAPRPPGSSPPSASRQTVDLSQPLAYPSVDGNSQALQLGPSSQAPTTASQIQPGKFGGKLPVRGRRKAGF